MFDKEVINQRMMEVNKKKLEVFCDELESVNAILLQSIQRHKQKTSALKFINQLYQVYKQSVEEYE